MMTRNDIYWTVCSNVDGLVWALRKQCLGCLKTEMSLQLQKDLDRRLWIPAHENLRWKVQGMVRDGESGSERGAYR